MRGSWSWLFGESEICLCVCVCVRGYSLAKVKENVEAEIMQVVRDEAFESYSEEIILELENNTLEDMEKNLAAIVERIKQVPRD